MIKSLELHSSKKITWHVLALTQKCSRILKSLSPQNIKIYELGDIDNFDLISISNNRKWSEFCFASGPIFLNYLASKLKNRTILGYIDADCFFYNDIFLGLNEFSEHCEIQIHEHRFSNDRKEWLSKSGRFNVGLVIGQVGLTFRNCLHRWSNQVVSDSSVDESRGTCGDQKYLDEWPDLYPTLQIMQSHGMGLAPWNLNNTELTRSKDMIYADDSPLVFFHFHGLQIFKMNIFFSIWAPAPGYRFLNNDHLTLYRTYIEFLNRIFFESEEFVRARITNLNLRKSLSLIFRDHIQFSFFKHSKFT